MLNLSIQDDIHLNRKGTALLVKKFPLQSVISLIRICWGLIESPCPNEFSSKSNTVTSGYSLPINRGFKFIYHNIVSLPKHFEELQSSNQLVDLLAIRVNTLKD